MNGNTPLPFPLRWPGPGPVTDYIDMELVIRDLQDPLRSQIIAARFEAVAAVHRAQADGAAKIASILGRKG